MRGRSVIVSVSVCALAALSLRCDSSDEGGGGALDDESSVHAFFDAIAVDLAELLGEVTSGSERAFRASPANCPDGGSASYDYETQRAELTACTMAGNVLDGTVYGSITGPGAFYILSGSLVTSGKFTGSLVLQSGNLTWQDPPKSSNTFWTVNVQLGASTVCVTNQSVGCNAL